MKKIFLVILVAFNLSISQAQEGIGVGFNIGIPVGNTTDYAAFIAGVDAEYLYDIYDETYYAGIATGFINAFTKDLKVSGGTIKLDNVQFLPVAAAARYYVNYTFYVGGDLGYAVGINEGNNGGIYYRPRMGFGLSEKIYINISLVGVSQKEMDYNTTTLGFEYRF